MKMSLFSFLFRRHRAERERGYQLKSQIAVLSPKQFARMYRLRAKDVESAIIVPPRLGSSGFGRIVTVTKPAGQLDVIRGHTGRSRQTASR